jgi:negative regulator of sigma-B (phosphoserine phosphatase)
VSEPVVQEGRCAALEWAVCASAYPGEQRSGDGFLVQETGAGALVAVVDGLGHGEEAADVAERAVASLRETAERSPTTCLTACHAALRGSRGAALTLAMLDPGGGRLVWVAVGNVEAAVIRRGRDGIRASRWTVPLRGGVVGDRLPPLRESTAPLETGDILVSATDGLAPAFLDGVDPSMQAPALARALHAAYARADDDALVLVVRCRADGA